MKTNCCTTIPEINHVLIFSGNKCSTLLLVHSAVHRTYMCSRSTYYVVVPLNTHSILKYHYPLILYVTNIYAGILMAEPHPASLQRPVLCFAQLLCLMLPVGVVSGHTQTVYRGLRTTYWGILYYLGLYISSTMYVFYWSNGPMYICTSNGPEVQDL